MTERLFKPLMYKILESKYKNPDDVENYQIGKIYLKKLSTNAFKVIYFILICSWSYTILIQTDYFPKSLGGSGHMDNMFKNVPDSIRYYIKPDYFDIFYYKFPSVHNIAEGLYNIVYHY